MLSLNVHNEQLLTAAINSAQALIAAASIVCVLCVYLMHTAHRSVFDFCYQRLNDCC